jgi:hypothetical protein
VSSALAVAKPKHEGSAAPVQRKAACEAYVNSEPHEVGVPRWLEDHLDSGALRAKLKIGGVHDPQEAEADRLADRIMSGGEAGAGAGSRSRPSGAGERNAVRRKPAEGASTTAARADAFGMKGGRALDAATRAFFAPHFGDLSDVRVHDDHEASSTAAAIGARAYTVGSDIGFAEGEFRPDTGDGRKLLAHELAHVAQGGSVIRRQAESPVRRRVSRSDIASRGAPPADWHAHFAPQKPPADPTDVSSIDEAQAWVKDLSGFEREEKQRFKIGEHLKSMIERLPPEVWLPNNNVISRSTAEDGSTLIVTGATGPIDTDNLRNKLYTMYLSVDRPSELAKPSDPTGLIWDMDIEQFVTPEEQAAAQRWGAPLEIRPFQLSGEPFTQREVDVLEFLFADEMLEWRRRDVAVQESVERERERRIGVFMAALGEASINAIGEFFWNTFLIGTGMGLWGGVAGWFGRRLFGLAPEALASAGWGTKIAVGTLTGVTIGGSTGGVDRAVRNAPDLARGDISLGDYFWGIASGVGWGALWGGVFGTAAEIASPFLRRVWNVIWPASKARAPTVAPPPREEVPPAPVPGKQAPPARTPREEVPPAPAPREEVPPAPAPREEVPISPTPRGGRSEADWPHEFWTDNINSLPPPTRHIEVQRGNLRITEPEFARTPVYPEGAWKWSLYDEVSGAKVCETYVKTTGSPREPVGWENWIHSKQAMLPSGERVQLDATGFRWSDAAWDGAMNGYRGIYASIPPNASGVLEATNLAIFQKNFAQMRADHPGWSNQQIANEAIKSTPFGRTRLERGYGDMRVEASDYGNATVRGVEMSDVPRAVTVVAFAAAG